MTHTLWRGSELLGEGELGPAPGAAGALAGPFRPTPAFAAVWPVFRALQAASALTMRALGALPRGASADEIRARLAAGDPANASGAALAAAEALGLEVRDAAGCALGGVRALVGSWTSPGLDDLTDDLTAAQRLAAERDAADAGVVFGVPNYVLTLVPRPPGPAPAGARAGARAGGL